MPRKLFGSGVKNPRATITEDQVRAFKAYRRQGYSVPAAAREAGITISQGEKIAYRGDWSHVN